MLVAGFFIHYLWLKKFPTFKENNTEQVCVLSRQWYLLKIRDKWNLCTLKFWKLDCKKTWASVSHGQVTLALWWVKPKPQIQAFLSTGTFKIGISLWICGLVLCFKQRRNPLSPNQKSQEKKGRSYRKWSKGRGLQELFVVILLHDITR